MNSEGPVRTDVGEVAVRSHTATTVHRVGYSPTPWQWTDWVYAEGGRFDGRWDDPGGSWRTLGLDDLDAAAIRDARPRALTRGISAWLYEVGDDQFPRLDGIEFTSRHGDDFTLWAIYERGGDADISPRLKVQSGDTAINPDDPDLVHAMELLGLHWAD